MEEFNEMVSFAIAHRDMDFEPKKIFRELIKQFGHLQNEPHNGMFYGVNLTEGLQTIRVTMYNKTATYKVEAEITLDV
tara:strand:+ start:1070 stop:1303 length:234 start_codon:yes stop_codon:yes gene_type:complete